MQAQKRSRRRLLELKQRVKGMINETGANLERLFRYASFSLFLPRDTFPVDARYWAGSGFVW